MQALHSTLKGDSTWRSTAGLIDRIEKENNTQSKTRQQYHNWSVDLRSALLKNQHFKVRETQPRLAVCICSVMNKTGMGGTSVYDVMNKTGMCGTSVYDVTNKIGMCGTSVHDIMNKIGKWHKCLWCHDPSFFCSALGKSGPAWLNPTQFKFESRKYLCCTTIDRTTTKSQQKGVSHCLHFQTSLCLGLRSPLSDHMTYQHIGLHKSRTQSREGCKTTQWVTTQRFTYHHRLGWWS